MADLGTLDPVSTMLLVIDMQNDFCHPDGALAQQDDDVTLVLAMAPRLERLVREVRAAGAGVIFVRTDHGEWTDSPKWLDRNGGVARRIPVCATGSWGADYFGDLRPEPADLEITKNRYSAFLGTNLDLVLRAHNVETLLLTGTATNVCVETTLRDGFMRGYRTILVEDCAASSDPAAHDGTVKNVRRHFGRVATADEALGALGATPVSLAV